MKEVTTMRCKVLINFPFSLMESYAEAIKMFTYSNNGLMNIPSNKDERYISYFHSFERANLFLKELFFFMVRNHLFLCIINDDPYGIHLGNHLKSLSVKLIENPVKIKRDSEFTIKYYVDLNYAGYATYIIKKRGLICPPFQIVRGNGYVEQQLYCHSVIDMVQILKILKARFRKKFIVVSIDYQ